MVGKFLHSGQKEVIRKMVHYFSQFVVYIFNAMECTILQSFLGDDTIYCDDALSHCKSTNWLQLKVKNQYWLTKRSLVFSSICLHPSRHSALQHININFFCNVKYLSGSLTVSVNNKRVLRCGRIRYLLLRSLSTTPERRRFSCTTTQKKREDTTYKLWYHHGSYTRR